MDSAVISKDLTLTVDLSTSIPDHDTQSSTQLYFFLASHTSVYSTVAYFSLRNSDHVVVPVSNDFLLARRRCFTSQHNS